MSEATPARPALRIVRGDPTPEELAAVVVLLSARSGSSQEAPKVLSAWAARDRGVRPHVVAGPGAWRMSAWPR